MKSKIFFFLFILFNHIIFSQVNKIVYFDELKVNCFTTYDNKIYVGTDKGIYYSTTTGESWEKLSFNQPDYNVISIDVKLPEIVFSYWDGNTTGGIYYSANNGSSWRLLNNGMPSTFLIKSVMFKDEIIYAAMGYGIYRLTDLNKSSEYWVAIQVEKSSYSSMTLIKPFGKAFDGKVIYSGGFNSWSGIASIPSRYSGIIYDVSVSNVGLFSVASSDYDGKIFTHTYDGSGGKITEELTNGIDNSKKYSICKGDSGIFVSTDTTIYISNNAGNNWLPLSLNSKQIKARKLFFFDKKLFISDDNEGLWFITTSQILFPKYKLTLETYPPSSGTTYGANEYKFGSSIKINTLPNNTNVFLNWTEDGKIISTNAEFNYFIGKDTKLTANYLLPPIEPIASNPESLTQTSFKAVWQEVNSATGYLLDVSIDENFNNILASYNKKDVKNVKSYMVTGLNKETTFFYRVKAYNSAGVSEKYSNIISVKTLPNPPAVPISKVATEVILNGFTANWNQVTGATGYTFDLAIDDKFVNILSAYKNKDVGNITSFTVTGLVSNMDYYYRVKAYNDGGSSGYSNIIKVGLFVGVEKQNSIPTEFKLYQNYPNPFNPSTKIKFDLPKGSEVSLRIFNAKGEEVDKLFERFFSKGFHEVDFVNNNLCNGVYFYQLRINEITLTKKMLLLK